MEGPIMVARQRHSLACAVLLTIAIAPVVASPSATRIDTIETLRFNGPVALPGVTLSAGDYTFDVNHVDSGDVVRVRIGRSSRVVYSGFTVPAARPRGLQSHKSIIFGEVVAGRAAPILGWFPRNRMVGYEFDYRDGDR
jgi:hypothetical protein